MTKTIKKYRFEPADIITIIVIINCFILVAMGKDGLFINMLNMMIGVYFGRKTKKND